MTRRTVDARPARLAIERVACGAGLASDVEHGRHESAVARAWPVSGERTERRTVDGGRESKCEDANTLLRVGERDRLIGRASSAASRLDRPVLLRRHTAVARRERCHASHHEGLVRAREGIAKRLDRGGVDLDAASVVAEVVYEACRLAVTKRRDVPRWTTAGSAQAK